MNGVSRPTASAATRSCIAADNDLMPSPKKMVQVEVAIEMRPRATAAFAQIPASVHAFHGAALGADGAEVLEGSMPFSSSCSCPFPLVPFAFGDPGNKEQAWHS